mgnify:CR=1 FL=1
MTFKKIQNLYRFEEINPKNKNTSREWKVFHKSKCIGMIGQNRKLLEEEKESVFYIIGVGKFGKHEFCSSFLETWDSIIFEHQYHCVPIGSN